MAFVPRTRETIRDQLLADWQAEYRLLGLDLSVVPGSHAWLLASGIALNLQPLEAFAGNLRKEILPQTASPEYLAEHGRSDGVTREPATSARFVVAGVGTALATANFTGRTLRSAAGYVFTPDASTATIDGSGNYTVAVTATELGAESNLPVGALLSWDALPTNVTTTLVSVSAVTVIADATERDSDYALRITEQRRERPGSGNRSDWRAWCQAVSGVARAYVYPLYDPTLGTNTPNAVTVVCVGPAQGDSTTNTRVLGSPVLTNIVDYIEGDVDAEGNALTDGVQLRAAGMPPGNYTIAAINVSPVNVDMRITQASAYAFPFSAGIARSAASTTVITVAGDRTALNGAAVLVHVGTANARGGYLPRTITNAVIVGPDTELTIAAAPVAPSNDADGLCVYPQSPNWVAMRDAIFELFDNLGPGDTSPAARWPSEESEGRSVLYPTSLSAALVRRTASDGTATGVAGVLAVEVVTPASATLPAALTVVTLGTLRLRP